MRNVIPLFINDRFKEGQFSGEFFAVTMFMDISGFTPITEKLMTKGKEGAEILSVILNTIFIPVINAIYESGGFISSFEGDAFTIIFKLNDKLNSNQTESKECINALYSALKIRKLFEQIGVQETGDFGRFTLSVKIGLSYGKIRWGIVGYERNSATIVDKTYFFRGEAIDGCANSEHQCEKGEIIIDKKLYHVISDKQKQIVNTLLKKDDYFLLWKISEENEKIYDLNKIKDISKEIANHFFSNKVLEHNQIGEFREVASVFISLKEPETFQELNNIIGKILMRVNEFGGYYEGLNFGDKGGNMLILFGAPVSYEDNVERAVDFILSVKDELSDTIRAGITFGEVYSGIKGSQIRCSYGVLGDIVNLSARFMMKANFGEIWTMERVATKIKHKYDITDKGEFLFKGKSSPIKVFEILGAKQKARDRFFEGNMVGRSDELNKLIGYCNELKQNQFGGIVYLYGDAGIGKSRFLYELREKLADSFLINLLQTDGILRKSMNPFIYFFSNYFEQSHIKEQEEKKNRFENVFNILIEQISSNTEQILSKNKSYDIDRTIKELQRTKSLIGALLGIRWEDSLYEKLSAKARFENTLDAIKEFFKAQSLLAPLVIIAEDLHWLDDDSHKVFDNLLRNIEDYPILIIASSRLYDDGSKPILNVSNQIKQQEIILSELPSDSIEIVINEHLGGKVNKELFSFIVSKTKGNPFYIEQFCLYLKENNLIISDGNIVKQKEKKIELPTEINSILMSRIDRLSNELKEAIQIASVLGNEFDVQTFYEMLEILRNLVEYLSFVIEEEFDMWALSTVLKSDSINPLLKEGELEKLWYSLSKLKYGFKHTLLREVVYDMQPRKRLQNLHRIAAEAIEKLYNNDETYYSDLAYHYEKAEIKDEAKKYLWKAGNYYSANYKNQSALNIYDRLMNYIDNTDEELEVYCKKAKILDLIGQWNDTEDLLKIGIAIAQNTNNKKREAELKVSYGWILQEKSDYDNALKVLNDAKDLSESIMDKKTLGYSLDNIGEIYRLKGDYDTAMKNFQRSLVIDAEIGDKRGASNSLNNIGNIYRHKHLYEKALECHHKSISMKELIGDKDGISLAYNNIAIIYWNKGDYDRSLEYLQKSLNIKEEMGNKRGKCISLNGLGIIYRDKGNYDKALECHIQSLSINEEVGDKRGISMCKDDIGIVYIHKEQYADSIDYFKTSLAIKEHIGAKGELGHTYSYLAYAYFKLGMYEDALDTIILNLKNIKEVGTDFEHGRTHLVIALILANLENNIPLPSNLERLLDNISQQTKLPKNAEKFFDNAEKTALNSNFLNTLVPALYEYGKYLYKKGNIITGANKIQSAMQKALKSSMMGEVEKIKKLCEEIKMDYNKFELIKQ